MEEIWRDIEDFEGYYQVSNLGRIKSLFRIINNGKAKIQIHEKILTNFPDKKGYSMIYLCRNGIKKTKKVHRLVCLAFIPNPDNKPCVNHKNGIKSDNSVQNLEWCNQSENLLHAHRTGLKISVKGESSGRSSLTEVQAKEIKYGHFDKKHEHIAEIYGVSVSTVYFVKTGRSWKHI